MKNVFGNVVTVSLFGESHGDAIGIVLDGMASGLEVDRSFIATQLDKRRPFGSISTGRVEPDRYQIVSGVFEGETTGAPICIIIPNENTRSGDYEQMKYLARPGHADYTAFAKFDGFEDYRGGGHFSGRITAPLVAAGAIAIKALETRGIYIGTHIKRCAGINDREFHDYESDIELLSNKAFAVLDNTIEKDMVLAIEAAASDLDSVGGILETAVVGLPAGIGEPWFDSIESLISHACFSIPAVKGIEFGSGFAIADMKGSQANDPYRLEGDRIVTVTNHNGGINGGISNGMPVVFRTAVKPTPSISKLQKTIDYINLHEADIKVEGRHDPCIVHRARIVQDSVTALVLCDLMAQRFGTDFIRRNRSDLTIKTK